MIAAEVGSVRQPVFKARAAGRVAGGAFGEALVVVGGFGREAPEGQAWRRPAGRAG